MKNRIEETRNVDMNAGIPRRVIQSSNNTIAVELINQRIDDLTQVSCTSCTDQALSADLRFGFADFQERINSSIPFPGTVAIRPTAKSSRMGLGEVKAREREIVRKGIDRCRSSSISAYTHQRIR